MITISDPGETLGHAQVEALTAKAAAYPFDIHVLIGTGAASRSGFEQQVASYVTPGSRMVSIGVDPTHHFSFVRSSGLLGVAPGPQVAQAGNPFFKAGNLVDGIDAIAAKANDLRVEPRLITAVSAAPGRDVQVIQSQTGAPIVIHEHHTAAGVWWALGGFLTLAAAIVVWSVGRARRREQAAAAAQSERDAEAAELRTRNIEEAGWHDEMASRRGSRPASEVPVSSRLPVSRVVYETSSYPPAAAVRSVQPAAAPVIVQHHESQKTGNRFGWVDTALAAEMPRATKQAQEEALPCLWVAWSTPGAES